MPTHSQGRWTFEVGISGDQRHQQRDLVLSRSAVRRTIVDTWVSDVVGSSPSSLGNWWGSSHPSRSSAWVPVTAGAWLVGVLIPVTALSLVPNGWPLLSHAIVGVAAAMAMGATVGAITGRTLHGLLARA